MKDNERTVTIVRVERLGTSVYGNPYFRLHLEDGTSVRTQINSMVNVGIENSENLNRPVIITTTKAGRVYDVKSAGTPILFKVGDKVALKVGDKVALHGFWFGEGVVKEVDYRSAAAGRMMIYYVAVDDNEFWFCNEELTFIENGSVSDAEGA